jgi:glutathione S-transferase
MKNVLHYFDCRSRGQALRFALVASGADFEDRRVPTEALVAWKAKARDPSVGGPFASLPILDWGDYRVAQTLAVSDYLSAKLGFDERFSSPEERARDRMIASAAHLDMQVPYTQLMWLSADAPTSRIEATARGLLDALRGKLRQLEVLHTAQPGNSVFFGGDGPSMADWFVYESLDRACTVFATAFDIVLAAEPHMAELRRVLGSNAELIAYAKAGGVPENVTASPNETAIRERLEPLIPSLTTLA